MSKLGWITLMVLACRAVQMYKFVSQLALIHFHWSYSFSKLCHVPKFPRESHVSLVMPHIAKVHFPLATT